MGKNCAMIMQAIGVIEDLLVFVLNELGGIGDEWENTWKKNR